MVLKILMQNAILLFYIIIGFGMGKRYLAKSSRQSFSFLLTNIALPCAIFNSFQIDYSIKSLQLIMDSFLYGLLFFLLVFLLSLVCVKFLRMDDKLKNIWVGCSTFSSILFIGIPIVQSLFGELGLLVLVSFNTVGNLFVFGFGESVFSGRWQFSLQKIIRTPAIIAAILGFTCFLLRIKLPALLEIPIVSLAGFTSPLSMILNGALLSHNFSYRSVFNHYNLQFLLVRLIVIPMIVMALFSLFITSRLVFQIVCLIACMPSGAINSVFAEKYVGEGKFASELVISSTFSSILTIPLFFQLFN
jgi:predicted permease